MKNTDNLHFRLKLLQHFYNEACKFNTKIYIDILYDEEVSADVNVLAKYAKPLAPTDKKMVTLNVSPEAITNLLFGDDIVCFDCRFNGASQHVRFNVSKVLLAYLPTHQTVALTFPLLINQPKEQSNVKSINSAKKTTLQIVK